MTFLLAAEEAQVSVAFDRLTRVYREARSTHHVPDFIKALERFVQDQVRKFPHLRDQVQKENQERDQHHGKRGQPYLWPSSSEQLKRVRKRLNESIASVAEWEKRRASRKR